MGTDRTARALHTALQRVQQIVRWPDERLYVRVSAVSGWSPAQHVQHALIALRRFFDAIGQLDRGEGIDPAGRGHLALASRALLWSGWIPRGRAQTPDFAAPDDIPSHAGLIENQRSAWEAFGRLSPQASRFRAIRGTIDHPVLGPLHAAAWWRFACIHTEHHVAIIRDIDHRRGVPAPLAEEARPLGEAP